MEKQKCLGAGVINTWENTDGGDENYRRDIALLLLWSILPKSYNIIIDRGISEPVYGREVVDGMNAPDKRFIFHLMETVQLPGCTRFDAQMTVQTETRNTDASLVLEFQKHLSNKSCKHGTIDNGKQRKVK